MRYNVFKGDKMRHNVYSIRITSEAILKMIKILQKNRNMAILPEFIFDNSEPVCIDIDNGRQIINLHFKTTVSDFCNASEGGELLGKEKIITSKDISEDVIKKVLSKKK